MTGSDWKDVAMSIAMWPTDQYGLVRAGVPLLLGLGAAYYYLGGLPFGVNAVPVSGMQLVGGYLVIGAGLYAGRYIAAPTLGVLSPVKPTGASY